MAFFIDCCSIERAACTRLLSHACSRKNLTWPKLHLLHAGIFRMIPTGMDIAYGWPSKKTTRLAVVHSIVIATSRSLPFADAEISNLQHGPRLFLLPLSVVPVGRSLRIHVPSTCR